jgi:hypothetical protein
MGLVELHPNRPSDKVLPVASWGRADSVNLLLSSQRMNGQWTSFSINWGSSDCMLVSSLTKLESGLLRFLNLCESMMHYSQ